MQTNPVGPAGPVHQLDLASRDAWDPLHCTSDPGLHWATSNLGEAMPGVQSPLSWTTWAYAVEHAAREGAYAVGGLSRREREVPESVDLRAIRPFCGRPAIQVEFFATLGDRMPGTTGEETVVSILGRAPEEFAYTPTRRRWPIIAGRLPATFLRTPSAVRRLAADQDAWYDRTIGLAADADLLSARAILAEALRRHDHALVTQTTSIFGVIQPLHDAITRLVEQLGAGDASVLTGVQGGAEMTVVTDIWDASRGRLEIEEVARRHGFHGPLEGELESRVWREDDRPLRAMMEAYAGRDDAHDPRVRDQEARSRRPAAERELLRAASRAQRPAVRAVLALSRDRLPLRGVAKRAFLQAFDVARLASRRIGEHLATAGTIADPEDVFYLTVAEITGESPGNARELVALRRERRTRYQGLSIPGEWRGVPEPRPVDHVHVAPRDRNVNLVTGIGVSAGVVEGTVRVLHEPDFGSVESDEILVAPTTDPSWSSVMFVSGALVVDIGGALSHAAVVARELELPCVVNTQIGTRVLRTGDRVRVDGRAGTVEILDREAPEPSSVVPVRPVR